MTPHISSMIRPTHVEALPGYRIHLTYADGVEGVIDLSATVGRGVFAPLADEAFFRTVHLGRYHQIAWSEDIEICPDAAYELVNTWRLIHLEELRDNWNRARQQLPVLPITPLE